ncbi:protein of unknown function [Hyphomicrobium sp. 1Nfss2.1]
MRLSACAANSTPLPLSNVRLSIAPLPLELDWQDTKVGGLKKIEN